MEFRLSPQTVNSIAKQHSTSGKGSSLMTASPSVTKWGLSQTALEVGILVNKEWWISHIRLHSVCFPSLSQKEAIWTYSTFQLESALASSFRLSVLHADSHQHFPTTVERDYDFIYNWSFIFNFNNTFLKFNNRRTSLLYQSEALSHYQPCLIFLPTLLYINSSMQNV